MSEIEYLCVGKLLVEPQHFSLLGGNLKPEFFEDTLAREIFETMLECEGKYTLMTFKNKFQERMTSEVWDVLLTITPSHPDIFKIYALKVVADWKKREKKRIVDEEGITYQSMQKVAQIDNYELFPTPEISVSNEYLTKVEDEFTGKENTDLIPSGFQNIDRLTKGFDKGELIFIGGRPGSGKTTLALNIAYNVAKSKKKVLFFSLEMTKRELHERLVKNIVGISEYSEMTQLEFEKVVKTSQAIEQRLSLMVNDAADMTVEKLSSVAVKMQKETGIDFVVIDHLNILTSEKSFKTQYELLTEISRKLKVLAKDLDVPVICCCQLNRALEGRDTKTPTLADLRGSGSIEQDANLVLFVYRPEYHLLQNKPEKEGKAMVEWWDSFREAKGKAKIIVAKNRRGKTGEVTFLFRGEYYRFEEIL